MMEPQSAIRPWRAEDPGQKAIPFLISRILDQRGGFRDITEESLQEEIATGDVLVGDDAESNVETGDDNEKPRGEQVQSARQDTQKLV